MSLFSQFQAKFPDIQQGVSLKKYTTFQIGGEADLFYVLNDLEDLPGLVALAKENNLPFFVLGGGSNTIFADAGYRGLVILMKAKNMVIDGERILTDAGVTLAQLIQASMKAGLTGMEKLTGLPGTVGGAVRGNAGAFGVETKDLVEKVKLFDMEKGIVEATNAEMEFSYRHSRVKETREVVLQATYHFQKAVDNSAMQETLEILKSRTGKQPAGKTSGSFFKNPSSELTAGRALEEADCKGTRVGDTMVSDLHANWMMNVGYWNAR
jgi:UDP-N-acetylmuramate dehydrogenase